MANSSQRLASRQLKADGLKDDEVIKQLQQKRCMRKKQLSQRALNSSNILG